MNLKDNVRVKVCFVLTHVPNPRMNKRIEVFKKIANVEVVCTRRLSQNIWEPAHKDIKHTIFDIDLPPSNHIIKRMYMSNSFRKKVFSELSKSLPDVIYAEGLDTLMIANRYKKNNSAKIVYEVPDLREIFIEKPQNTVQRIVAYIIQQKEKKLFSGVDYLVVTSPKFYDLYYYRLISKDRVVFVPNVPDRRAFQAYKKKLNGKFTVAFIGGIRYLEQMKLLVDAATDEDIDVLFAGAGGTDKKYQTMLEYSKDKKNIRFTGRYDYDKEIAGLYGKADCIYSVYDADNANVRIALPNKLYEAVLCELPIIVAKGTYLSELVEEWGVGVSVDHKNKQELAEQLRKLRDDKEYYENIIDACKKIKESINIDHIEELVSLLVG